MPFIADSPWNSTRISTSLSIRASSLAADPKTAKVFTPSGSAHPYEKPAFGEPHISASFTIFYAFKVK